MTEALNLEDRTAYDTSYHPGLFPSNIDYAIPSVGGDLTRVLEIVKRDPKEESVILEMDQNTIQADFLRLMQQANLAVDTADYNKAVDYFSEIREDFVLKHPGIIHDDYFIDSIVRLANVLMLRGGKTPEIGERIRDFTDAKNILAEVVKLDPNHGERCLLYAKSLLQFVIATPDEYITSEQRILASALSRAETAIFPVIGDYNNTKAFNQAVLNYIRIHLEAREGVRFTGTIPRFKGKLTNPKNIASYNALEREVDRFIQAHPLGEGLRKEDLPMEVEKDRPALLKEAIYYFRRAEKLGVSTARRFNLYDGWRIASRELEDDEPDRRVNALLTDDSIAISLREWDFIMLAAKEDQGKTSGGSDTLRIPLVEAISLVSVCRELERLYKKRVYDMSRGVDYEPITHKPKETRTRETEQERILAAKEARMRGETPPEKTKPEESPPSDSLEGLASKTVVPPYEPGSFAREEDIVIKRSYVNEDVEAAIKQTVLPNWPLKYAGFNRLRELVEEGKKTGNSVLEMQAYAALAGAFAQLAKGLSINVAEIQKKEQPD